MINNIQSALHALYLCFSRAFQFPQHIYNCLHFNIKKPEALGIMCTNLTASK